MDFPSQPTRRNTPPVWGPQHEPADLPAGGSSYGRMDPDRLARLDAQSALARQTRDQAIQQQATHELAHKLAQWADSEDDWDDEDSEDDLDDGTGPEQDEDAGADEDEAQMIWTAAQADAWRAWLRERAAEAGYLTTTREGLPGVYYQALATTSGLSAQRWRGYLTAGVQPSHQRVGAIAHTLGLHPLAVARRAGLLTQAELAAAVATDRLPSPAELLAAIEHLEAAQKTFYGPAYMSGDGNGYWMRDVTAVLRQTYNYVAWLSASFNLRADDFGATAASALRAEVSFTGTHPSGQTGRFTTPRLAPPDELPSPMAEPAFPPQVSRRVPVLEGTPIEPLLTVDPEDVGDDTDGIDDTAPTLRAIATTPAVVPTTEHGQATHGTQGATTYGG